MRLMPKLGMRLKNQRLRKLLNLIQNGFMEAADAPTNV